MKRLSNRLTALEQRVANAGTLTHDQKTLLVTILAKRDALFWPWRVSNQFCEIRHRQRDYLSGICGITAKADGRNQWKSLSELRRSLVADGYLTAVSSGGQVTSLFLTATGEATSRRLVGDRLCGVQESYFRYAMLKFLTAKYGPFVREQFLYNCDCTGDPESWSHLTERVLPLLVAGVVESHCDTENRILFSVIDGDYVYFEEVEATCETEAQFDELYLSSFGSDRNVLASLESRDSSEVYVPQSASLHWRKLGESIDE